MATVNNLLTRIHDAEGALTTVAIGGGQGATANTDIYLQGAQSLGRRITTTTTPGGFTLVDAADNNASAAEVHAGIWFWVTHYAILTDVNLILSSGTALTNYDEHNFDYTNEYPNLGGWVRGWIDVSRTPDVTGGTGLNEAQLRQYGISVVFSAAPGGNAQNVILDSADYTNGGAALSLTGTTGLFSDFSTSDSNTTNQYGVFREIGGVYNCYARVQLGTATSLSFDDSNFSIVFPQQSLVSDTFMGLSFDLQNASTTISLENGSISSSGTKRGDFVVTGTSGDLTSTNVVLSNLRVVTLTAGASVFGGIITGSGLVTPASALMDAVTINASTNTQAMVINSTAEMSNLTSCLFTNNNRAINITAAGTYTFDGHQFSGNTYDVENSSTGLVTINASNGCNVSTFINTNGGTTTIVNTKTFTVNNIIADTEIRLIRQSDLVELAGVEVVGASPSGQNNMTVSADADNPGRYKASYSYGYTGDVPIYVVAFNEQYQALYLNNSLKADNSTLAVFQTTDRQYDEGSI